ncbi:MAG: bifunctional N(6)-L-threonylcarbamoyladenine synthase/serine/threonine protein kinase [Thermoplasmata archaeon]|nr:bifunctional N(6)-L-threonylcarbamoyladenine synthase/serine/threonine protein kinase [Thermoplasmata archaeon]
MKCVGVESTAHTFSVGVVDGDRVLSIESSMYVPSEGGIHPREAADHHAREARGVLDRAMSSAGVGWEDVELVAFSQGPGLGPCLRVGATMARAMSASLGVPLVGVNHCVAHLEIGTAVTGATDPVLLYASGGNTQVIAFSNGRYRVFGETLDIGIGNMLDKFAREMGIPFPGGPRLEELARDTGEMVSLPYSVKGMDVAFSGILTAALSLREKGISLEVLSNSIQETCFAMLVEVAERAMAHTGKEEILLGGGVAANRRLQEMCDIMAGERGARCFVPPRNLLVDNGAMIAVTGVRMYRAGVVTPLENSGVRQRFRTDEVEVVWR